MFTCPYSFEGTRHKKAFSRSAGIKNIVEGALQTHKFYFLLKVDQGSGKGRRASVSRTLKRCHTEQHADNDRNVLVL